MKAGYGVEVAGTDVLVSGKGYTVGEFGTHPC